MKRRRPGSSAAPQPEACDVWLDTAELKQGPAQCLPAKPRAPSRAREPVLGASQPRSRQTSISSFFRTHTDEKDKENSRPSPFILNRAWKGQGASLAASPVKILALPRLEEAHPGSLRAGEGMVQVTPPQHPRAPAASWLSQAESHSRRGLGQDCCCLSFTQGSEGMGLSTHESHLFLGKAALESSSVTWECGMSRQQTQLLLEAKPRLQFQPRCGGQWSQKPLGSSSVNSLIDSCETESVNPALVPDSTRAAAPSSSPACPAAAQPLRELSHNTGMEPGGWQEGLGSASRQLFTQDSEGHRVIAHGCWNLPSPPRHQGSSGGQLPSSPGRSSPVSHSELCWELLFTQDSEGNRVIKH